MADILSPREIRRYTKQIMIPGIGIAGQEKLKQAKVLVIGAGGLGCPVLQYLTAAGIGKIGIVEFDVVDETNLQRQILYGSDDVGKLKSVIASERLKHMNSLVDFEIFNLKFDASNSSDILKDYDLVIDATDNIESRYVISDASAELWENQWFMGQSSNMKEWFRSLTTRGDQPTVLLIPGRMPISKIHCRGQWAYLGYFPE